MVDMEHSEKHQQDFGAVTTDRIAEILADENLQYVIEDVAETPTATGAPQQIDQVVRTGFVNQSIVFAEHNSSLVASSQWRGRLPREEAARALAVVNEWNALQIAPGVRMYETPDEHIEFMASRSLRTTHGLSTNQLGAFALSTIDSFVAAWDYFETTFPELVSWEHPADKHAEETSTDDTTATEQDQD